MLNPHPSTSRANKDIEKESKKNRNRCFEVFKGIRVVPQRIIIMDTLLHKSPINYSYIISLLCRFIRSISEPTIKGVRCTTHLEGIAFNLLIKLAYKFIISKSITFFHSIFQPVFCHVILAVYIYLSDMKLFFPFI